MGWNLKSGNIQKDVVSEDEFWTMFNFVFSSASMKTNTYKFELIKAILDNLFNASDLGRTWLISYDNLFGKFAENYWNLVVKYELRQMRYNGKSEYSALEKIFIDAVEANPVIKELEFSAIEDAERGNLIKKVAQKCRRNVIGALYGDFDGLLYGFDLSTGANYSGLYFSRSAYDFLVKFKMEIEKLNYYSWARYLEEINDPDVSIRIHEKLELATPKRNDLSPFREVLRVEFEEKNCFYCGKKLERNIHVDHFIPWKFVKEDNLWNLVLTCPQCNLKKNSKLPDRGSIDLIVNRNKKAEKINDSFVVEQFSNYNEEFLNRIWQYARMSGYKEISHGGF